DERFNVNGTGKVYATASADARLDSWRYELEEEPDSNPYVLLQLDLDGLEEPAWADNMAEPAPGQPLSGDSGAFFLMGVKIPPERLKVIERESAVDGDQGNTKHYQKADEGRWVTLEPSGTHVMIDEHGGILAGPAAMAGKPLGGKKPAVRPKPGAK